MLQKPPDNGVVKAVLEPSNLVDICPISDVSLLQKAESTLRVWMQRATRHIIDVDMVSTFFVCRVYWLFNILAALTISLYFKTSDALLRSSGPFFYIDSLSLWRRKSGCKPTCTNLLQRQTHTEIKSHCARSHTISMLGSQASFFTFSRAP